MSVSVNPRPDLKNLLIELIPVEGAGLNATEYKNPMILDMVLVSYVTLAVGVHGSLHWSLISGRRSHIHRSVMMSRPTFK